MIINHLTLQDKEEIKKWEYTEKYATFNYALKKMDGLINTVVKKIIIAMYSKIIIFLLVFLCL